MNSSALQDSASTGEGTLASHALRTIGQALESLHLDSFELLRKGNDFVIRAQSVDVRKSRAQDIRQGGLAAVWRRLRDRYLSERDARHRQGPLELRYSSSEIDRLDRERKARSGTDGKKPDLFNLSEMLRLVGTYADNKRVRLLKVAKREQELTLEYETEAGEIQTETHDVASFYDLSVHMYLKRSNRHKPTHFSRRKA